MCALDEYEAMEDHDGVVQLTCSAWSKPAMCNMWEERDGMSDVVAEAARVRVVSMLELRGKNFLAKADG